MAEEVTDVHSYEINGVLVQTGDLICNTNGDNTAIAGAVWRLIGLMIPGAVDHTVIYVGPEGRCVEAGAKLKVITFNVPDGEWKADEMTDERGPLYDTFYGVVYPLENSGKSPEEIVQARIGIANYCIEQANANKPYNVNFLNSETEDAYYCSQLAFKAYQKQGIDLNTNNGVPHIPFTESIVFPQEIWSGDFTKRKA
jgi:hypothetical protein